MRIRLIAAGALAAGALAAPAGAAHAATDHDPAPATAASSWLDRQLGSSSSDHAGLLPSSYGGANYGASADAILGLAATGKTGEAAKVATALSGAVDSYISGDASGDPGSTYAGSVAKAAEALRAAGDDPTNVNGENLITRLEGQVQASGRIQDTSAYGDYENTLGQAYAAGALTAAGSSDAGKATDFLLTQQCSGGWFRLSFTAGGSDPNAPVGTDESCDADPTSSPSVDATAVALLELAPQKSDPAVAAAIDKATTWLDGRQRAGAWTDGTKTGVPNVNSTGLAGWALGALGDTGRAEKAAAWVRGRQLANIATCTPYATGDLGAIAYDPAAWKKAQTKPVGAKNDQFVVGTAQAIGVLQWAPGQPDSVGGSGTAPAFVKGGSTQHVTVEGGAPGAPICGHTSAADNLVTSVIDGAARVPLKMPTRTGVAYYKVTMSGASSSGGYDVLGKASLKPTLSRTSAPKGSRVVVTVKHLANGEHAVVKLRGKKVAAGQANAKGVFRKTFSVTGKPGRAVVSVVGQFADRAGKAVLRVVR